MKKTLHLLLISLLFTNLSIKSEIKNNKINTVFISAAGIAILVVIKYLTKPKSQTENTLQTPIDLSHTNSHYPPHGSIQGPWNQDKKWSISF